MRLARWFDGWLLVVVAFALLLRLALLAGSGFDGLYGQDAYAYLDAARALRQGAEVGRFYWPLGYPALLALAGAGDATGQTINLLLGALLPALVYTLTRQAGSGRAGALIAALLMSACGQAVQSSLVTMADIPALAWATASAVALGEYRRRARARWLVITAVLLALAAVTRWVYLLLALPWALAVAVHWRGLRWRQVSLAAAAAFAVLLPQIIYTGTHPAPRLYNWDGWSAEHALRREFQNVEGAFHYEQINALFYLRPVYDALYLPPLLTAFVPLGWAALLRRRRWPEAALLAGWPLLIYAFLIGVPHQNIRYPLIVFPAVAALVGLACDAGFTRLGGRVAIVVGGLVIVGVGQMVMAGQETIRPFIARQQSDRQAAVWAARYIASGATIYTFGLALTLRHRTGFDVVEIYYETPETLAGRWRPGQADYLLLNLWEIENRWQGLAPQVAYHWLRDRRGLERIGREGYYTLFRVKG